MTNITVSVPSHAVSVSASSVASVDYDSIEAFVAAYLAENPSGGGLNWLGEWDSNVTYVEGDAVYAVDGIYLALANESANEDYEPVNSPEFWSLFVPLEPVYSEGSLVGVSIPASLVLNDFALYLRQYGDLNHSLRWGFTRHGIDGPVVTGFGGVGIAVGDANDNDDAIVAEFRPGGVVALPGYTASTGQSFYLYVDDAGVVNSAPLAANSSPEVRADTTASYSYIGNAPDGTAEGSSGWTVTRITIASPPVVMTGSGTWTGRAGLTYS